MAEDEQWAARRFAAAYAVGALLVAGYAFWHYLMGTTHAFWCRRYWHC